MHDSKLRRAAGFDAAAAALGVLWLVSACGGGGESGIGGSAGASGAAGSSSAGASGALGSGNAGSSGALGSGDAGSGAVAGSAGTAGALTAGNPDGSCSAGIPATGKPVSTASPTSVVGDGSPASCSFDALKAAVAKAGVITFNCGPAPVTIAVTATLNMPTDKNTVIDGGNRVTLDGGKAVQILRFDSANFQANESTLTLQHLALKNGKATPTEAIPDAPAPCSQGFNDGEGGALYMRDGNLTVIDSTFSDNQAAPLGPDTGGGAIYILGSKHGALIVSSSFTNNSASNGGGVGGLFSTLAIYNSLFTGNKATGHDANNNEPSKCSAMNNGQNETGSGGNGGPIYSDGNSVDVTLCGDQITNNSAGMNGFGGGLFFTSNNLMGVLTITDTTMTGNTGGSWTNVSTGSVTNVGTAVGVNAKSISVTHSTLQGYP
ncbi:MAG: hypothetical protein ABJB12_16225 [Pseudomonadota bacterium]